MDTFVSRKRRRNSSDDLVATPKTASRLAEEDSTDVKLAILSSLFPERDQHDLLEVLLSCDGSVELVTSTLSPSANDNLSPRKKSLTTIGLQSSLPFGKVDRSAKAPKPLTKKGKTLHVFSPEDVAAHTPCSIIHNFLPSKLANDLLQEILPEATSYHSATFKLFDNVVKSPHSACFYVENLEERNRQRSEYLYNGSNLDDVREILPVMRAVQSLVRHAVNQEIQHRIQHFYPHGQKLLYQSPHEWQPNAAFVNCYDGPTQSVGYHSDQLSYLGPHPVIGSLSLGVAREFRVRRIVPKEDPDRVNSPDAADVQGQIAIHLPHNSLLVMHAEMQEEWKHAVAPALRIDPHPVAGNKRINVTYRWYRDEFHPHLTPKCRCGVPTVLKTVQRQKANRGRYMWMCQVGARPGAGDGCGFFEWARFTEDGVPVWKHQLGAVEGNGMGAVTHRGQPG